MKIPRTVKKAAVAAVHAAAILSAALCLNGTMQICLCDTDPDGCGSCCHDCETDTEDGCRHVTFQIDAPLSPESAVATLVIFRAEPIAVISEPSRRSKGETPTPPSTAPPDSGGRYISNSERLYPRT